MSTKDKILDAAERAFADHGYSGTSLRSIIADAGVNLAAVHYHFGSKEQLLKAVVVRRAGPVNVERLAMLDECERAGRATLEAVLAAFLVPTFRMARRPEGERIVRLMGRLWVEEMLPKLLARDFAVMLRRFDNALQRALPELPVEELWTRLHWAIGATSQALRGSPYLPPLSAGDEAERTAERLVDFLSAGFRAPVRQFIGVNEEA
jgi:AcrR family transcriptional regulator